AVVKGVHARWTLPALARLRALYPRQILDLFAAEGPADDPTWEVVHDGLARIFFTPMSRLGERDRHLDPRFRLDPGERNLLRRTLVDLARVRLPAVVSPVGGRPSILDRIAANLDLYDPTADVDGEVLGF